MKYIIDFQSKVIEMGDARNIASDDLMASFSENFNEPTRGIVVEWEAGETNFKASKIGIVTEPYEQSLGFDEEKGEELFETVTPPPLLTLKENKTLSEMETTIGDTLTVDPKKDAKAEILLLADSVSSKMLKKFTQAEIMSFPIKGPAARAYLENEASSLHLEMLTIEAKRLKSSLTNTPMEDTVVEDADLLKLATSIDTNSALFSTIQSEIAAIRQLSDIKLENCTTAGMTETVRLEILNLLKTTLTDLGIVLD